MSDNENDNLNKLKPKDKGGRPKGTVNGHHKELLLICEKHKINLFEEIVKLCKHPDVEIAGKNIERALPYVYAKRKAVEISGSLDINHEEQNKTVEFLKTLASKGRLKIEPSKP